MAEIFRVQQGKHRSMMPKHLARILTKLGRKRSPSCQHNIRETLPDFQSFELGLLRCGRRRARLTVLTPRRLSLLATTQNASAQTIQCERTML